MICRKRLPKGEELCIRCVAHNYDGLPIEFANTKAKLVELLESYGFKREEYSIKWLAYNEPKDNTIHFVTAEAGTKKEVIKAFWNEYYHKNKALAQHG